MTTPSTGPVTKQDTQLSLAARATGMSVGLALLQMHRQLTVFRHRHELADIDRKIRTVKEKLRT